MNNCLLIMSLFLIVATTISFRRQKPFAPNGDQLMEFRGTERQKKKVDGKEREYYVHRFENQQYQAAIYTNLCPIQGSDLDKFLCGLAGRELGFDEDLQLADYVGKSFVVVVETEDQDDTGRKPLPRATSITPAEEEGVVQ